jgi:predicted transcriptional regulator
MSTLVKAATRIFNRRGEASQSTKKESLSAIYGPLELAVLQALWNRSESASVKALQDDFPDVAYTTLMTTLDRLYKKGALVRGKRGRAFFYAPRLSRDEVRSEWATAVFTSLLDGDAGSSLILSSFVGAIGELDELLLDELEELLRRRRGESIKK